MNHKAHKDFSVTPGGIFSTSRPHDGSKIGSEGSELSPRAYKRDESVFVFSTATSSSNDMGISLFVAISSKTPNSG